jgi:extracellular matrix protein 14
MQLNDRIHSLLHIFVVLAFCTTIRAFTLPWAAHHNPHAAATDSDTSSDQKLRSVFPQLTWLRDTAIEKVFGVPKKDSNAGCHKARPSSHTSNHELPAKLLAKYGEDVVLRFNLTTPQEEKALAEAADTLFLDVWEFTNNWADIRLRKDDVGCVLEVLLCDDADIDLDIFSSWTPPKISQKGALSVDARPSRFNLSKLSVQVSHEASLPTKS